MLRSRIQGPWLTVIYAAFFLAVLLCLAAAHADRAAAGTIAASASESEPRRSESVTYVTTAYYLNVRVDSSAKSKILDVVKQGTKLDVVAKTNNGWLKLAGQGYVHGAYAKPADSKEKSPVPLIAAQSGASAGTAAKPNVSKNESAVKVLNSGGGKFSYEVQTRSGLSEADIAALFEGTGLEKQGLERAVLDVEDEYGINAYFTIAVMRLESGNGNSGVARNRNNLFGLNSSNGTGYLRFKSKVASVEKFGQLIHDNYIGKGYNTIEKIGKKYCPANSKWPALIKNTMKRDYNGSGAP